MDVAIIAGDILDIQYDVRNAHEFLPIPSYIADTHFSICECTGGYEKTNSHIQETSVCGY